LESVAHIDADRKDYEIQGQLPILITNRISRLIYLFDNRLLQFIASIMTCVARVPRLSMQ